MPVPIQRRTPLVIALTIALALLLMWPAWMATQNGLSDLYARPAIDYLEGKRYEAYAVTQAEWQAIENNVIRADKLMPGNPRYLETLGLLQQLKLNLFDQSLSVEERDELTIAGDLYFQRAVESRPTWSYYWGNLALEYYRYGNYGAQEYSLALANASRFGRWKSDMQRLVIDLGSETWEFLSPEAQREVILSVERGLYRQPQNTRLILSKYDTRPDICEAINTLVDVDMYRLREFCANESVAD